MAIQLQDKLYTSAQVADILGVSLRTLYRYMEDGRILSMRTASGRHRFTKDQIMDFLNAGNILEEEFSQPVSAPKPAFAADIDDESDFIEKPINSEFGARNPQPIGTSDFDFRGIKSNLNKTDAYAVSTPVAAVADRTKEPFYNGVDYHTGHTDQRRPFVDPAKIVPVTPRELEPEDEFIRKESALSEDELLKPLSKTASFGLDDDFDVDSYFEPKKPMPSDLESSPVVNRRTFSQVQKPIAPSLAEQNKVQPYRGFESDGYTPINRAASSANVAAKSPSYSESLQSKSNWEFSSDKKPLTQSAQTPAREELSKSSDSLSIRYYKSEFSDLIDLAKKIKGIGSTRGVDYAFTLNAGLSLHFSINPFEILHFYINPEDLQVWKSDLKLSPVRDEAESNVGVLINTEIIFPQTKEIGGFKVLDDKLLFKDLVKLGDQDLVRRFRSKLGI
jgi:excisionase family DNA binding protein